MKKVILFISGLCQGCPPIIEKMDSQGINYEKIDITGSMTNLKIFLKLRDKEKFFDKIKEGGYVGVPTLMVDDKFYDPYEIEEFKKICE